MYTVLFLDNVSGSYMSQNVICKVHSGKAFHTWIVGGPEIQTTQSKLTSSALKTANKRKNVCNRNMEKF